MQMKKLICKLLGHQPTYETEYLITSGRTIRVLHVLCMRCEQEL